MLEWIWFGGLSVAAIALSLLTFRLLSVVREDLPSAAMLSMWASMVAAAGAIYLSWPVLGAQVAASVDNALPQPLTSIHSFSVVVIVGLVCITYFTLVLIGPLWWPYDDKGAAHGA